jgi:hypothetical protein
VTDTNELTGRELAVACARAMGWTVNDRGAWFDPSGWPLPTITTTPRPSVDELLAWLHEHRDCIILGCYRGRVTACASSAVAESIYEEGATLTEALQRLVVASLRADLGTVYQTLARQKGHEAGPEFGSSEITATTPAPSVIDAARAVLFHGLTSKGTLVAGPQLREKLLALKAVVDSHDVRSWERSEVAQFGEPAKAPSALERLRERVRTMQSALGKVASESTKAAEEAVSMVLAWIDEEREAGHG